MTKQKDQICTCGKVMNFPDGQIKTTCPCGTIWEMDEGGVWFSQLVIPFATKGAKVRNKRKRRASKC